MSLLKTKLLKNDAKAKTLGEYLVALVEQVIEDGEEFSGKRPFGNSDWELDLIDSLTKAKIIKDENEYHKVMKKAIKELRALVC